MTAKTTTTRMRTGYSTDYNRSQFVLPQFKESRKCLYFILMPWREFPWKWTAALHYAVHRFNIAFSVRSPACQWTRSTNSTPQPQFSSVLQYLLFGLVFFIWRQRFHFYCTHFSTPTGGCSMRDQLVCMLRLWQDRFGCALKRAISVSLALLQSMARLLACCWLHWRFLVVFNFAPPPFVGL